eukprot:682961-Rhodomonas_salina.1
MLLREHRAAVGLMAGRPGQRAGEGAAGDEACVDGAREDGERRHQLALVAAQRVVQEAAQLAAPAPAARRRPHPLRHPAHVRQPLHEPVLRLGVGLHPHRRQQRLALLGGQPLQPAVRLQEAFQRVHQADVVVRPRCPAVRLLERAPRQRLAPAPPLLTTRPHTFSPCCRIPPMPTSSRVGSLKCRVWGLSLRACVGWGGVREACRCKHGCAPPRCSYS